MNSIDLDAFRRRGYAVVPQVFTAGEAEEIRGAAVSTAERIDREEGELVKGPGWRRPRGDLLTHDALRRVLLDSRILDIVRRILGDTPVYWGESSVWVGADTRGPGGWHRDARHQWVTRDSSYRPLVRCGLYLQDTSRHSDGLAVRAGTHLRPPGAGALEKLREPLETRLVSSRPGDLVVWDMRIVHMGKAVRFRPVPGVPLPHLVQRHLPDVLRAPVERDRVTLFMSFGLAGAEMDGYLGEHRSREGLQRKWKASRFSPSVLEDAATAGLKVMRPIPEYGTTSA